MSRDLVIAPTLTNAKQCVPPRSAPVSSQSSTANMRAHSSANDSANKVGAIDLNRPGGSVNRPYLRIIAFGTRTSTVPDRAPLLHASPTDRHLYCRESRRTPWNPSRTLARRRLLVG